MTQKESRDELTLVALILRGTFPGTDQIAHRLVRLVGDPDRGQFSSTQKACKTQGIKSISLDPLSGSDRDQGRSDHAAFAAGRAYLPVEAVARRPGLVAGRDVNSPGKLLQQLANAGGCVLERAKAENLVTTLSTRDRDRKFVLGHINSDVNRSLGVPHVFLHRKRTAPAAPRPEFRLIRQGWSVEKTCDLTESCIGRSSSCASLSACSA